MLQDKQNTYNCNIRAREKYGIMIVVKVDNSVRDQAFSHCLPGLDTLNQTYFHLFMSVLVMCIC